MRLALKALWWLARNSRCWSSRQVALKALVAVAVADGLDVDEMGLPDAVTLAPSEKPTDENYLGMWG